MTITNTSSFTVTNQASLSISGGITVLPPVGAYLGNGRLVHPVLGTLDYYKQPDFVSNMDGDAIIPPVWTHTNTLGGGVDALWDGNIRDIVCVEEWTEGDILPCGHVQTISYFHQNPPDNSQGQYILWYPNYRNGHCYEVCLIDVKLGKKEYNYDAVLAYQQYFNTPLAVSFRLVSKVS